MRNCLGLCDGPPFPVEVQKKLILGQQYWEGRVTAELAETQGMEASGHPGFRGRLIITIPSVPTPISYET